jgi:capsular exopolysaccharide synthesis family protein
MSKIERALRKAEEERRKREAAELSSGEDAKQPRAPSGEIPQSLEEQPGMEHFRKIAAKLVAWSESSGASDVIFVSAVSGEGKTTAAVNCAVSLCRDFNLSVCLVDGDLRKPQLSDYQKSNGSLTIVDILKGEAEIDSVIQPTSVKGLSLTASYRTGSLALPLLNSERLGRFVRELRSRFDFVIFDSSPILPVADTVALSKCVSALALVVESGKTRRKHLEQVFEQIDRDKVIGFIMNYKKHRMPETYSYMKYYDYGRETEQIPQNGGEW